jgi:predicted O-methyltransferase YrrM
VWHRQLTEEVHNGKPADLAVLIIWRRQENVAIARAMIAHAGLTDRVVHIVKPLDQAVEVRLQILVCYELHSVT